MQRQNLSTSSPSNQDGTEQLPAITFATDTGTGVYRIGDHNIGVSTNGVKRIDISSAGTSFMGDVTGVNINGTSGIFTGDVTGVNINGTSGIFTGDVTGVNINGTSGIFTGDVACVSAKLSSGSVSLPSLAFTEDTNTGLYRIKENNIGMAINGSNALDLSATGLSVKSVAVETGSLVYPSISLGSIENGLYSDFDLIPQEHDPPRPLTWESVIWSPEQEIFVAVSSTSYFLDNSNIRGMTSTDGINWTMRNTGSGSWKDIAWSPELGLFVIVSNGNSIVNRSTDGITWVPPGAGVPVPSDGLWTSVTWSPELGIFAAVRSGNTGRVMTSPDGIYWSLNTGHVNSWRSIVWSPQLEIFVSVATNGGVMTSPNGTDWTLQDITLEADSTQYRSVCWSPEVGRFVAVGTSNTAGRVMTSDDGITWVPRTNHHRGWQSVTWAAEVKLFLAVGNPSNVFARKDVMSSPDGIVWTLHWTFERSTWYKSVTWSPKLGMFVAVSFGNTEDDRKIMTITGPNVSVVVGGTKRVDISSRDVKFTDGIKVADGTASLPSISFTSNTDTGLYKLSDNNIGLSGDLSISGIITSTAQPLLVVHGADTQTIPNNDITTLTSWSTPTENQGFTSFTSGVLTIATAGVYMITYKVLWGNVVPAGIRNVFVETNTGDRLGQSMFAAYDDTSMSGADIMTMAAGSTLRVQVYHDHGTSILCGGNTVSTRNRFSVYRLN